MARIILQWRDKKPMAAVVKSPHVICSLTVVKCYFADSFGGMLFEQKICLNYGTTTMLGSKSCSIYLKMVIVCCTIIVEYSKGNK